MYCRSRKSKAKAKSKKNERHMRECSAQTEGENMKSIGKYYLGFYFRH